MEHLTLDSFKEKICECGLDGKDGAVWKYKGEIPAIVDFYADWCGPCKMIGPILEQLSKEYEGKVNIYKVNTENEPGLAQMFDIQSIPTLLFIPMDEQPQVVRGALPKPKLVEVINTVLKPE